MAAQTADAGGGGTDRAATQVRPTHGADNALRLTVDGPEGRLDLAVPAWLEVASLSAEYAERWGLADPPRLATASGRVLEPSATLEEVVDQGELLVVAPAPSRPAADPAYADRGAAGPVAPTSAVRRMGSPALLVLAGACALGAAAVFAGTGGQPSDQPWLRPVAAGVLLLGALLVAVPRPERRRTRPTARPGRRDPGRSCSARPWRSQQGFVVAFSTRPGGPLLALAVGGLAAVVVAAVARTGLEGEREDATRVWLVSGALLVVASVGALLLGAGLLGLASLAFALAVVATRMLPSFVVDVPDEVLLDLDRLAVTAWSARERPRGGRKRHQVRPRMVTDVARRSQRTVAAGVVVTSLVGLLSAPVVVLGLGSDPSTWARWGGVAMVLLGAASLALVGRTFRSLLPRVLLGATACVLVALTAGVVASELGTPALWYGFAAAAVVAPAAVLAAVQLGGGWRSVWWGRVGEILETMTGVVVLALVPLASGLFDLIRTSVG